MRSWTIAFLFGLLSLTFFSSLNSWYLFLIFIPLGISIILCVINQKIRAISSCLFVYCLGFLWLWLHAWTIQQQALPETTDNQIILAQGMIAAMPEQTDLGARFNFLMQQYQFKNRNYQRTMLIRITWPQAEASSVQVGQVWQFRLKIKKIYGFSDPGSFDYEQWAFAHDLRATAYVINNKMNKQIAKARELFLLHWRQKISSEIALILVHRTNIGLIQALAVGNQRNITAEQWQVFSNTGTNHLMIIAGLHIGICAGFLFWLVNYLWRRVSNLALYIAAPIAASFASLIGALVYSALAGFSLPTTRAFIMLTVSLLSLITKRNWPPFHSLSLALVIILMGDPLAVLTPGFWLSFCTVAIIIYSLLQINTKTTWFEHFGRVQYGISLGLLPLTLLFFQYIALVAFIANLLAIPWIGFVIEPLCILGAVTLSINHFLAAKIFFTASWLLQLFWPLLVCLANEKILLWHFYIPNLFLFFCFMLAVFCLLAPKGFPARYLAFLLLVPILFNRPAGIKVGEIKFTLLDVGQGLASVIETAHHVLIYDTGPKFSPTFDAGAAVVVPFLRTEQITKIDKMVISHGDSDHIGGATSILNAMPVLAIETSVPNKLPGHHAHYCLAGEHWRWDGVNFRYLYPTKDRLGLDNNSSCVLLISNANYKILLTGDIEATAEAFILQHNKILSADILVAPHHGSKTSSTENFVAAVAPKYVLFPTGEDNRYHFPNLSVIKRYEKIHAALFNTAKTGAITFIIKNNQLVPPICYRSIHKHFWNN